MVPGETDDLDGSAFDAKDDDDDEEDGYGVAVRQIEGGTLPTLRVFPHGISRKRLEQAIRDLQLPVIVARDVDEADVGDDASQRVPPEAARDPRG